MKPEIETAVVLEIDPDSTEEEMVKKVKLARAVNQYVSSFPFFVSRHTGYHRGVKYLVPAFFFLEERFSEV